MSAPGDEDVRLAAADEQAPDARLAGEPDEQVAELGDGRRRDGVDLLARRVEGQDGEAVVGDLQVEDAHGIGRLLS